MPAKHWGENTFKLNTLLAVEQARPTRPNFTIRPYPPFKEGDERRNARRPLHDTLQHLCDFDGVVRKVSSEQAGAHDRERQPLHLCSDIDAVPPVPLLGETLR